MAYDDFDPWGMVLEGRSGNIGGAEARFQFTGKERDTETGYDYPARSKRDKHIYTIVHPDSSRLSLLFKADNV